jgi:hypothetical protein
VSAKEKLWGRSLLARFSGPEVNGVKRKTVFACRNTSVPILDRVMAPSVVRDVYEVSVGAADPGHSLKNTTHKSHIEELKCDLPNLMGGELGSRQDPVVFERNMGSWAQVG